MQSSAHILPVLGVLMAGPDKLAKLLMLSIENIHPIEQVVT